MVGDILQPTHLLFILVVALLVLGPKRLPEVGKTLGSGLRDFRQAISGESLDQSHNWAQPSAEPQAELRHRPPDEPDDIDDHATSTAGEDRAFDGHSTAATEDAPLVGAQPAAATSATVAGTSAPAAPVADPPRAQPVRPAAGAAPARPTRPVGQPIRQTPSARSRPTGTAAQPVRPTQPAAGTGRPTGQSARSIPRPGQPIRSTARSASASTPRPTRAASVGDAAPAPTPPESESGT